MWILGLVVGANFKINSENIPFQMRWPRNSIFVLNYYLVSERLKIFISFLMHAATVKMTISRIQKWMQHQGIFFFVSNQCQSIQTRKWIEPWSNVDVSSWTFETINPILFNFNGSYSVCVYLLWCFCILKYRPCTSCFQMFMSCSTSFYCFTIWRWYISLHAATYKLKKKITNPNKF